eukprot:2450231-Alexandrium_andersonii.AAC.1
MVRDLRDNPVYGMQGAANHLEAWLSGQQVPQRLLDTHAVRYDTRLCTSPMPPPCPAIVASSGEAVQDLEPVVAHVL